MLHDFRRINSLHHIHAYGETPLDKSQVEAVPEHAPGGTKPPIETRVYTLTMNPTTGGLGLTLVPPVGVPQDNPLQMNVPNGGCSFAIKLDRTRLDWKFIAPYIEIGRQASQASTPPRERYYALTTGEDQVMFSAVYNEDGPEGNTDPFNISVQLMEGLSPIMLTIDPDIKNPGDNV